MLSRLLSRLLTGLLAGGTGQLLGSTQRTGCVLQIPGSGARLRIPIFGTTIRGFLLPPAIEFSAQLGETLGERCDPLAVAIRGIPKSFTGL